MKATVYRSRDILRSDELHSLMCSVVPNFPDQ